MAFSQKENPSYNALDASIKTGILARGYSKGAKVSLFPKIVKKIVHPVALALGVSLSVCAGVNAASLTLVPDQALSGLSVGDSFSVSLLFDDEGGAGLSGFATNLTFDSGVIDYTSTSFNPALLLSSQGAENSGGFDVLNITGTSPFPIIPGSALVTGSGVTVAQFFFDVIGAGVTSLGFAPATADFAQLYAAFPATPAGLNITGSSSFAVSVPAAPIPLPASSLLLGFALAGLAAARRLRRS